MAETQMAPEKIAGVIVQALQQGRVASWREMPALLMAECGLEQSDALAICEAVSRKWQARFFPPITRMELFITENCNLRCDYCFVHGKNAFHAMKPEIAKQAVDFLMQESRDKKQVSIFFMGGEPFLEFDLMRLVVDYAQARAQEAGKEVDFSVTTNGTLFDEDRLAFCATHGVKFLLSIDGDRATHDRYRKNAAGRGSFDAIMRWLPRMKHYQPWMGARMTVHPDSVRDILSNFRFLVGQQINYFIIGPASGVDWSREELDIYEEQMRAVIELYKALRDQGAQIRLDLLEKLDNLYEMKGLWGCQAGRHSLTIASNGDIYPCSKMLGLNDLAGIYRLGDLEHGITDLEARAELIGMWPKRKTKCMTCDLADACSGGCFANNYEATGSIYEPCEVQCEITRRNFHLRQYAAQLLGYEGSPKAEKECVV